MKKMIIAVDGPSSSGKGTLAKDISRKLGYIYVDTGAMYRVVALYCLRNHIITNGVVDKPKLLANLDNIEVGFRYNHDTGSSEAFLGQENVEKEIRQMHVSNVVSKISSIREVRELLIQKQREMGQSRGVVMDGRDIGTVVFPDANVKIFMTADEGIRAQRRYDELKAKGDQVTLEEVRSNQRSRDFEDINRADNPLKRAEDAILLDNTNLTREQQLEFAMKAIEEKVGNGEYER